MNPTMNPLSNKRIEEINREVESIRMIDPFRIGNQQMKIYLPHRIAIMLLGISVLGTFLVETFVKYLDGSSILGLGISQDSINFIIVFGTALTLYGMYPHFERDICRREYRKGVKNLLRNNVEKSKAHMELALKSLKYLNPKYYSQNKKALIAGLLMTRNFRNNFIEMEENPESWNEKVANLGFQESGGKINFSSKISNPETKIIQPEFSTVLQKYREPQINIDEYVQSLGNYDYDIKHTSKSILANVGLDIGLGNLKEMEISEKYNQEDEDQEDAIEESENIESDNLSGNSGKTPKIKEK